MPSTATPPAGRERRHTGASLRRWVERSLVGALLDRLFALNPIERSLALGSKLFTAVVPLTILMSSVVSSREAVGNRLVDAWGLTGAGADAVRELFKVPSGYAGSAINVVGVLVLLYSVLSFARALQRMYEEAWGLPSLHTRGLPWSALWIVSFAVYFSLSAPLSRLLRDHGFSVGALTVSLVCGTILWLVTPAILLGWRVEPRRLIPGGVVTAVLLVAFSLGSHVYLPRSATTNVERYGLVGVTFTVLTWLFAFSLVLVTSAAWGAVLSERFARFADGGPRRRPPDPGTGTGRRP